MDLNLFLGIFITVDTGRILPGSHFWVAHHGILLQHCFNMVALGGGWHCGGSGIAVVWCKGSFLFIIVIRNRIMESKKKEEKVILHWLCAGSGLIATGWALHCEMLKSFCSGCPQLKPGQFNRNIKVLQGRRMLLGVLQPTADHLSCTSLLILTSSWRLGLTALKPCQICQCIPRVCHLHSLSGSALSPALPDSDLLFPKDPITMSSSTVG